MTTIVYVLFVVLISALVFASGWRMCSSQNAFAGGIAALLLFLLHPTLLSLHSPSSLWDALFVMLFLSAWLWMEHWSLFMRSWVLAGFYAFGLWVGSPFVLWGLIAMVPWVIFNRRPLAAVGSLATVFLGGFIIFSVTWSVVWFFIPEVGRPLISQWVRWNRVSMPSGLTLPWLLLALATIVDRWKVMVQSHRSDTTTFASMLIVITILCGSATSALALSAISAPLLARALIKREFLYHRGVRWMAGSTFVLAVVLAFALHKEAWVVTALAMVLVGITSRGPSGSSRTPWYLSAEAICVGAYAAQFLGTLLNLFPN